MIHNGPLLSAAGKTDMFTTLTNGYIQNQIHRYVLGTGAKNTMMAQYRHMIDFMHFPPFKRFIQPTLREANNVWHRRARCRAEGQAKPPLGQGCGLYQPVECVSCVLCVSVRCACVHIETVCACVI